MEGKQRVHEISGLERHELLLVRLIQIHTSRIVGSSLLRSFLLNLAKLAK